MRIMICYLLVGSLLYCNVSAMDSVKTNRSVGGDLIDDAGVFVKDAGAYFTIPFHLSGKGWVWTAGIFAGTTGIMLTDKQFKRTLGRKFTETPDQDPLDGSTVSKFVVLCYYSFGNNLLRRFVCEK